MIDKDAFDEYSNALNTNAVLLWMAISRLDLEFESAPDVALKAALAAKYAALVKDYGEIAAQAAIEFYTQQRAAAQVASEYKATAGTLHSSNTASALDTEALIADAQNVINQSATPESRTKNLAGRAVQRVYEYTDEVLQYNACYDPAHPKWALVPNANACGWCVMMGSQGFVYTSKGTAKNARHANCKCTPVVDFDTENPKLEGYDDKALYDEFDRAREIVDKDAWARWEALSDEEKAKYGGKRRGDYDHFRRNLIIAEMDKRARRVKNAAENGI